MRRLGWKGWGLSAAYCAAPALGELGSASVEGAQVGVKGYTPVSVP